MRHVGDRQRHDFGARCPARASRPPLIRDRCLRTMFISPIGAPRTQQRAVHLLLLREAKRRRPARSSWRSRRRTAAPAAGRRRRPGGETQRFVGGCQPGFVGHGMAGLDHPDPPRRHAVAVARGGKAGQARRIEPERVEIVPLRPQRPSRRRPCRRRGRSRGPWARRQVGAQHDVGMRRRDGRVEDRTQEGSPVGHGLQRGRLTGREVWLSIQSPQKKTPAASCGGWRER